MTIEFHTAYGKIAEKLIAEIRNEIMLLAHINKSISRAEVFLKMDEAIITADNKICEIRLLILGDNLLARSRTENFEKSSKDALKKLKQLVTQQVKKHKEQTD